MKKSTLLFIAYLTGLHLFVLVVFWKPGFYHQINPFAKEHTETYEIFYNNMLALQLRLDANISGNPILFIGDSITQGMCVSCIHTDAHNFGIGLDTTAGVLHRIGKYQSLRIAKAVVLAIGLNDTRVRSNKAILNNYRLILAAIPADKPVIVSAVLPIAYHPRWPNDTNDRIKALNQAIEKLCSTRPACQFVDFGPQLSSPHGQLDPKHHIGDGIHPSQLGYQKLISGYQTTLLQHTIISPTQNN